jgi:hypothetical protein
MPDGLLPEVDDIRRDGNGFVGSQPQGLLDAARNERFDICSGTPNRWGVNWRWTPTPLLVPTVEV